MSGNLKWCGACEKHHWKSEKCYPKFDVVPVDHGYDRDDAWKVQCHDAKEAAERLARDWDCQGDYDIVGGRTDMVVDVYAEDGTETRWTVVGEAVPEYTARPVKEDES